MSDRVTILYIGGLGRSGSTILAQVLGRIPGFVNVGELWQIWDRGLRDNELCGCGQPCWSCGFWNAVGEEAFGGWNNVDVDKLSAYKPLLKRYRYIPIYALMAKTGLRSQRMDALLEEYGPVLERLYRAIQSVSGARVIVDSSKSLPYAFFLDMLPFADLRMIYLVRDSRAVAYSWSKEKVRPEVVGQRTLMRQRSPVNVSRVWTIGNYSSYGFLSRFPHTRLRYEDFTEDPAFYVRRTLTRLGVEGEAGSLRSLDRRRISLTVDHTVSGNPGRFRTGKVELRPDHEWKEKMGAADRHIVSALTAPLLLKYGYLGRGKKDG
jgi:Sulfotransferase domain